MENHEGEILRNYLKGKGLEMGDVAEKLKMSRQNLNYHLRKEVLDDSFKRLIFDKMKISFPLGKQSDSDIKYTFQADQNQLISEMIEQVVALTAKQNIITPIVQELYAAHRNEMLTKIVNELDTLIASEAKRLLEIIQQKWNLK